MLLEQLVISGGEPTLLGEQLFLILSALREKCPSTRVLMLSNALSHGRDLQLVLRQLSIQT